MTFPILSANGPSGYNLTRSLRFRYSATAYMNRTPASAGNRQKYTYSLWIKVSDFGNYRGMLSAGTNGSDFDCFRFTSSETIQFFQAGGTTSNLSTTAVYRDPASWYHIVLSVDTTQATTANRVILYINNVAQALTGTYPAQNATSSINNSVITAVGAQYSGSYGVYFGGYMAEVNFVDGQALTPSSFGSTNSTTGVWQPAKYTGTYGTNGFYLPFTNTTSTTTLGYDSSGNGNNWTTNNISLTTGATYDSMTDVPTLTSATAANYAVMNPLNKYGSPYPTVEAGNLNVSVLSFNGTTSVNNTVTSSIAVSTGKWYFEMLCNSAGGYFGIGVTKTTNAIASNVYTGVGSGNAYMYYGFNGNKYNGSTGGAYGSTWTTNDLIGVAIDFDTGSITFYKNNTSQGTAYTWSPDGSSWYVIASGDSSGNTTSGSFNFGQRPFSYTPPSGFVALNTYNLPASTIQNGAAYMAATLYTGTGASQAISNAVNGVSFQPDFVWAKQRGAATDHVLYDVNRTGTYSLTSNNTAAEVNQTSNGCTVAFGSNGFTAGADTAGYLNYSARTYVAWNWKAGGTAVSNTAGSITSSVSANTTSGFSIVTYTGNGTAGATIGHGLGVAPSMVIVKSRSTVIGWPVGHTSIGWTNQLELELTIASTAYGGFNNTAPTSSVVTASGSGSINGSGNSYVMYCFAAIKGFSAFGSYTGNASTDGPFVYLGFRPRFVMIKLSSAAGNDWYILDTARSTSNGNNVLDYKLYPNSAVVENGGAGGGETTSSNNIDALSNGFKCRTANAATNASGGTFIYAAFAENPFQNSLAR